jgi:NAD(P)-dependent dehydrogenase (short-subunit alcohol dehydrogenase family)
MARAVVITGAGRGLGFTLSEQFSATGDNIWACDVAQDRVDKLRSALPNAEVELVDIGDRNEVDKFFGEIPDIDVLVNNVGVAGPDAPIEMLTQDDWADTLRINLSGAVWCIQHAVRAMKARGGGSIVNISSTSVKTLPLNRLPYVASKAALESVTLAVARETGPFNIRCNAVRPGAMDTERLREVLERVASRSGDSVDAIERKALEFVSMRTKVSVDDVVNLVVFLASDAARHITGEIIAVDGGLQWEA